MNSRCASNTEEEVLSWASAVRWPGPRLGAALSGRSGHLEASAWSWGCGVGVAGGGECQGLRERDLGDRGHSAAPLLRSLPVLPLRLPLSLLESTLVKSIKR